MEGEQFNDPEPTDRNRGTHDYQPLASTPTSTPGYSLACMLAYDTAAAGVYTCLLALSPGRLDNLGVLLTSIFAAWFIFAAINLAINRCYRADACLRVYYIVRIVGYSFSVGFIVFYYCVLLYSVGTSTDHPNVSDEKNRYDREVRRGILIVLGIPCFVLAAFGAIGIVIGCSYYRSMAKKNRTKLK